MQHNARVLAALLDQPDPDLARVVHHAVAAGTVAAHGLCPFEHVPGVASSRWAMATGDLGTGRPSRRRGRRRRLIA
jgi:hypothetical protein